MLDVIFIDALYTRNEHVIHTNALQCVQVRSARIKPTTFVARQATAPTD